MKYQIVDTFPNAFFNDKDAPMVSIYQETSRHLTDNKRDSLVFKNLVKSVEASLMKSHSKADIKPLMTMFTNIENESTFWSKTKEGIAIFATLDDCIIYNFNSKTETFAVVADSFHIKPLIEYHQLEKSYQFLDVDGQSFQILEGNQHHIKTIELDESLSTTMDEMLGKLHTDGYLTHGTYGGAGSTKATYHGHGGKKDEVDIDLERFFRRVDKLVYDNVSKISKMPMILLSPEPHHALFFKSANNSFLEEKAIDGTYESMGSDKLMAAIESYAKIEFDNKVDSLVEKFNQSKSNEESSDQLTEIVRAALSGRVETILLEKNKIIAGKIDRINKKIITKVLSDPATDDILDDLAQLVIEMGGDVLILDRKKMPTKQGAAAIYRY